jgi:guanylate kinase
MANLIIVSGPQVVGKMTVAEELRNRIGDSLMVNHNSIEKYIS